LNNSKKQDRESSILIMQSSYIPWIGFYSMLTYCESLVILDDVQFDKGGWRNRNYIISNSRKKLLTVPILQSNLAKLNTIEIDNSQNWQNKHLETIRHSYCKGGSDLNFYNSMKALLAKDFSKLVELNSEFLRLSFETLGLHPDCFFSSQLSQVEEKNLRLVKMMKLLGKSTYLTGPAGLDYLDLDLFKRAKLRVKVFEFDESVNYPQSSETFIPKLSIIDYILNMENKSQGPSLREFGEFRLV
jgi:hypothetical protein